MSIELQHITKTFGSFFALRDVNLRIETGELVALLGPSGSGKTTLLRIIAGLEFPDLGDGSGKIFFDESNVANLPAAQRGVGLVFQHYALFKHMTVLENIAFGLRVRPRKTRPADAVIRKRVMELLELVQLANLHDRYPSQLSGGQRQRVALARAMAVEPKVLLLDEPFGALDARVRSELRRWLRRLHEQIHMTGVIVTHDQEEALEVADRVVVMNHAKIEQVGTPDEVFHQPANEFVMRFLGSVNLFHARHEIMTAPGPETARPKRMFVRPHDLEVTLIDEGTGAVAATLHRINSAGPSVKLQLDSATGDHWDVELSHQRFAELKLQPGANVFVKPRLMKIFADEGDFSI